MKTVPDKSPIVRLNRGVKKVEKKVRSLECVQCTSLKVRLYTNYKVRSNTIKQSQIKNSETKSDKKYQPLTLLLMAIKIPLNCMEWASQTHLFVLKYLSQFFINFENQGQF